jgi:hypothetical protein
MRHIFTFLIHRTASIIRDEALPLGDQVKTEIEVLTKHEFFAVAGGPEVDNDPQG